MSEGVSTSCSRVDLGYMRGIPIYRFKYDKKYKFAMVLRHMQRRRLLKQTGICLSVALAGCAGGSPDERAAESSGGEQETAGCSDAIRILSEFEDFPEGGTYKKGNEPTKASLQISFENTADVPVYYTISATFIEFSTGRERDAGTISGTLEGGNTRSHEFVYEGSPQTVVEIDDYELAVQSECS
ncbi:hypothetical protein GCM10009066_07730 [Halarchaeum salinum]|uniref:Uncharacterized protein n=1 Tax=Halarchaeum salinum TaxID=489912 RepID=A0AAV3S4J6_9EURY